jgi:hypothetical protein
VANVFDTVIDWAASRFGWDTGPGVADPYAPLWHGAIVLLFFWLGLYALYRRKIFLRI